MRDTYHKELDLLVDGLVRMVQLVDMELGRATTALLGADIVLADKVIAGDVAVDALHRALDERALVMLACQQPVATDLRIIVASLRMSADLGRMGDLARHVAEVARRRHPRAAVPPEFRGTIEAMGRVAQSIVVKAGSVLASRDAETALELQRDDDEMDRLQESLYRNLLGSKGNHAIETAMDLTLIGRYYERYADHAVSLARRVVFMEGATTRVDSSGLL